MIFLSFMMGMVTGAGVVIFAVALLAIGGRVEDEDDDD